jgi:hypothetical protein
MADLKIAVRFLCCICSITAGCTLRATDPLPVGPDTYTTSAHALHGGTANARQAALNTANQRCVGMGKHVLVTNINQHTGVLNIDEANVDVTFRCLAANDPELRRPNLQQVPDVVIQDQR